jgi:Ca2+-binding EF-hand superfamily protein
MNRIVATLILVSGLILSSIPCGAEEKKDHVCFRALDTDKDGRVSFEEFAAHYGNDEARFNAVDADKDGKLTHDEYHDFLGHGS